jgi:hypothetical protein
MSDYDSCVVRVVLEYLYGGVFNLAKLSEHRQLAQLRRLARSLHLDPLRDCLNSLEISEVEEEEEDEKSRGFFDGVDNTSAKSEEADLHRGTQNLEALSALLEDECEEVTTTTKPDEDSGSKDVEVEDDWDEFCVALTQKSRERTATTESRDEEREGSPPGSDLFDERTSPVTVLPPPPASPSGSEVGLLKKGSVASESEDENNPTESLNDRQEHSNWYIVPIDGIYYIIICVATFLRTWNRCG